MSAAGSSSSRANIWILDDDEAMCALLIRQFQKLGWVLNAFHHPRQLSQALQGELPDLLVLDQLLPEKLGLEVLAGLRQRRQTFPVLVLSALGGPTDRIAGLEAGADDYLSKPFHFRELQLRIERLLRPSSVAHEPMPPLLHGGSFQLGSLRFESGPQQRLLTRDGVCHRLSRGDCALLLAFCRRPGLVLSRDHLLRVSGSLVAPGQSRTIDVRLSRLRRLLRTLTGDDLITPQRGKGYRLVKDVSPLGDDEPVAPKD